MKSSGRRDSAHRKQRSTKSRIIQVPAVLRKVPSQPVTKGAHTRSKNPSIYWSKKLTSKFWLDFWPCGRFFWQKYIDSKYWRIKSVWYILTSRQYFDNSSTFWRVCGLLSRFWSKIQSSDEQHPDQAFSTQWILIKISMERVWAIWRQKSYHWTSIFCFKILTVFLIVYETLKEPMQWLYRRIRLCYLIQFCYVGYVYVWL